MGFGMVMGRYSTGSQLEIDTRAGRLMADVHNPMPMAVVAVRTPTTTGNREEVRYNLRNRNYDRNTNCRSSASR
jgi:hypothetical protein